MADETTTESTTETDASTQEVSGEETGQPQSDSGELDRIRTALKNANKEAEKHRLRAKELEDLTKSDEDKRNERFAELEKSDREKDAALAEREAKLLRYEIAAAKGLDLKAALRLQGSTREEIEADADEFAKEFGAHQGGPRSSALGRVNQQGGATSDAAPGIGRLRAAYSN
jgi:hypothetical protein